MNINYYRILGITQKSSSEEIKSAYRKLVRKYHPDVNHNNSEIFYKIQEAYDTLIDDKKRKLYDTYSFKGKNIIDIQNESNIELQKIIFNILSKNNNIPLDVDLLQLIKDYCNKIIEILNLEIDNLSLQKNNISKVYLSFNFDDRSSINIIKLSFEQKQAEINNIIWERLSKLQVLENILSMMNNYTFTISNETI